MDAIDVLFPPPGDIAIDRLQHELDQEYLKTEFKRELGDLESDFETKYFPSPALYSEYHSQEVPCANYLYDDDFAGEYDFQIAVKGPFRRGVYSEQMQTMYLSMGKVLSLGISTSRPRAGLWLRAALLFRVERNDRVQRCRAHREPCGFEHVFTSVSPGTTYADVGGILCSLTPLLNAHLGAAEEVLDYRFHCMNSCPTGINRRATVMVFALEDAQGRVLGKRSLKILISSHPKRDKRRDEERENRWLEQSPRRHFAKKKKVVPSPPKEPSLDHSHDVHQLSLNVVGEENYRDRATMKYAYDVMAGQAIRPPHFEMYMPYLNDVMRKMS